MSFNFDKLNEDIKKNKTFDINTEIGGDIESLKQTIQSAISNSDKIKKSTSRNQNISLPTKKTTALLPTAKLATNAKVDKYLPVKSDKGNAVSRFLGNIGYGLANGLISLEQQVGRVIEKQQDDMNKIFEKERINSGLPTNEEVFKEMFGENYNKPIINIGEKLEAQKEINSKNIQRNIDNSNGAVEKKLTEIAPSIGQMLPGMLPGGAVYFAGSASGNYYDEAKQRGMNEEEAQKYSGILGALEGATGAVGAKLTKSVGKNIIKGNAKNALKMFGLDVAENFAEEAVMEPLSETTATLIGGKETADWSNIGKRMLDSGIDGALVSMIMGGASAGIGSSVNIVNKINNGQSISTNEINTAKNDVQSRMTDKQIQQKLNEAQTIIDNINKQKTEQITPIENNQEILYNNAESESGINERYKRNIDEGRNRIYKEQENQKNREYNWDEYNKWEQSIKTVSETNLANNEKESIKKAKLEYNKDILIYDENENNNTYSGGASQNAKNKIIISRQKAEIFGLDNMIEHETVESDILHNDEARDILSSVIDLIQEDNAFELQKDNFWKGQEGNMPSDNLIAKDILCDRFAEIKNGEKLDYDNVLSVSTNANIDMALTNYYKQIYGKELGNTSSFSMPEKKVTRKAIQQNLLEDTGILNESLDNAKNLKMLNINRTDPIRLQEKVFGEKLGTKINDMFFNKVKHNTAEKTRFLNKEREDIKSWGIKARSLESEALQKYTEKSYVNENGEEIDYTEADLYRDIENQETRNRIKKASQELRKKYDNYIDTANEVLTELGYDAIPKRKDYVRHFTELNDIFTRFGIPGKLDNEIPTDINGITDSFRPGKNFFANAKRRYGNKTTYDAITGIDGYIEGISNLIYHTEDIQRLRAFDKYIRETYGEKGFEKLENLSEENKKDRIENISNNHLSNYVSWLTEYTNNLAGKKSGIDRSVEKLLGRNIYSALDTIKKQTGSNMTGFNIGSALTNFISIAQGASKTNKLALLKGTASTVQNIFKNDGFVEKSDFLTNRFGSDRLSNNTWQKTSNAGQVFMSATDYFSSNLIVRSKYYENLAKGMKPNEAIKNADDFGARILGDRSQGATANIFNSKMLGIVTQFQLEVNNQMDTMIHDTIKDFKNTSNKAGGLKASMGAVWTLGQMAVYQYVFNEIFEAVAGRRPAFDIIDIIKTAFGLDDENDEDTIKDNLQEASTKLIEALPFINLFSENARIPITSAIPNPISIATGESTIGKEVSKLIYLLPPAGGSQAKKTIEGVKTVADGGSYAINSKGEKELRFPVENANVGDYIKAGVLGKYALPLAKEYVNRDYKRLSANQTKTYEDSNLPYKEYLQYIDKKLKKNKDKINYLSQQDWNVNQKWGIYVNDIFSSTKRKEDGGSQVSDAKYITSNGVSKSEFIEIYNKAQKNNIDIPTAKEYKEMKQNGIILENYINYKINVKTETEKQKKDGKLKETENLKNKDKIQVLLDSKYSDKEKSAIYEKYIKTQTKEGEFDAFKVIKACNMDINEYLKYEQQDIASDKKDDGTLNGKSVSNSKKKKVINYLNSMNIQGNQRLLLYAMQGYSTTSSQKNQLVNYVQTLELDNETRIELYNKFSGFTAYKNGNIKW